MLVLTRSSHTVRTRRGSDATPVPSLLATHICTPSVKALSVRSQLKHNARLRKLLLTYALSVKP